MRVYFLFLSFTFTDLWIVGNGASITENDATNYVNSAPNPTEGEKLWECTAKFWEHELYRERYKNAQNSWDDILKNTEQQIEIDGSLNNLDLILQQICYTVLDMDIAYNLTIDILDFCHGEKATFTPEELLIVKEKLRKKLCYADMRASVLDKQKCMVESREYQEECVRKYHNPKVANFDMYFGATKYCTGLFEIRDCMLKVYRENCDATITKQWKFFYDVIDSHCGCDFNKGSSSRNTSSSS